MDEKKRSVPIDIKDNHPLPRASHEPRHSVLDPRDSGGSGGGEVEEVKCMCLKCSKLMLNYSMRIIISMSIIGFSFYKLLTKLTCDGEAVYISLLTSILSFWLGVKVGKE